MSRFQEKGAGSTPLQGASVRLAGCAAVTVVSLSGWAGTAAAQAAPELGARLSLRAEYDDNLARGSGGVLRPGLDRKDDYIYSPSLVLNTGTRVGRQRVFVVGDIGYKYHQYNKSLNSANIGLQTGLNTSLGRCGFSPTAEYERRQTNLEDVQLGPPKSIRTEKGLGLATTCSIGRIVPTVSVDKRWSHNSSSFGVDSSTTRANVSVGYGAAGLGVISLVGSYAKTAYDDNQVILNVPRRNAGYEMYTTGFNYSRPIGARLSGSAGVQYYWVKGQSASDDHGFSGDAGLNYKVGPRLYLNLTAKRSVRPANQVFASRSIDTRLALEANYKMSSRLTLNGSVGQLRKSYDKTAVLTVNAPSRDRRFTARAGAHFRIGEKTSLSMDYSRETNKSDLAGFSYTSNKVAVVAARSF